MEQTTNTLSASVAGKQIDTLWWAVATRFLIHGLVISTWVSRIPAVKSSLALSDGSLGMALLGTAVGSLPSIPACGWIVIRFGSKKACTWTSVGLCLALLLPAMAVNSVTLFAALVVFGAMAGANDVAMNAQAVSVEKLLGAPTMSRFHAMFSVGGIVGAAAGGLIASQGIKPFEHLSAAAAVLVVVGAATSSRMADSRTPGATAHPVSFRQIPATLLVLSAIGFCIFLSEGAIADWTAVYLRQVLGATAGVAAAGYAVFSASMAVFRLSGDAIAARLGPAWTIRGGGLLAAFGLGWALLVHSPGLALPGFALAGVGFSSIIPLVFAAGGRVRNFGEGAGVATVSGLGYLGFLVGPPTIGFLSELTSLRIGLLLVVALSVLAAVLVRWTEMNAGERAGYAWTYIRRGIRKSAENPIVLFGEDT